MNPFIFRSVWQYIILAGILAGCAQQKPVKLGIPVVNPTIAEDIFYFTWAKSRFRMKAPKKNITLSFYAYQYRENTHPLQISINGNIITYDSHEGRGNFMWHSITVPRGLFVDGVNEIEFLSDSPTINSFAIGVEYTENPCGSSKSENRGGSWYYNNIGFNYSLIGEYAIRLNGSGGKSIQIEFVGPDEEDEPRTVRISEAIELIGDGDNAEFIENLTLKSPNLGDGNILQVRSGSTRDITKLSWTPWHPVTVRAGKAVISPVRLPYFQWRILSNGK